MLDKIEIYFILYLHEVHPPSPPTGTQVISSPVYLPVEKGATDIAGPWPTICTYH